VKRLTAINSEKILSTSRTSSPSSTQTKFIDDNRPFTDPDAAARKLLHIVRGSIAQSGLRYAYTGATNTEFTRAGGSIEEYSVGMKHAAAQKWFEVDTSGTRINLLADGAE
jgi:hypothetical protein